MGWSACEGLRLIKTLFYSSFICMALKKNYRFYLCTNLQVTLSYTLLIMNSCPVFILILSQDQKSAFDISKSIAL